MAAEILLYGCWVALLLNFGVLCLNVKLYTEILKDQSQNRRASKGAQHG